MAKIILLVGLSGSGKSTYAKKCLLEILNIQYLKTITTKQPRTELEKISSIEYDYDYVDINTYNSIKSCAKIWDESIIHNNYYAIDISNINPNTNYILNVYPDLGIIKQITRKYPGEVITILIDSNREFRENKILSERPKFESLRLRAEKDVNTENVRKIINHIFIPENNIEIDGKRMVKLIESIILK